MTPTPPSDIGIPRDPFANDVLGRLIASNQDYQRSHGHYIVPLSERLLAARQQIEELIEAIDERAAAGHNDTCQSVLETDEAYPCNCGHVAILAARSVAIQAAS